MKNYVKYLLVLFLILVMPFKVFASEVTNVYIDKENSLSFTALDDYDKYQVYIKASDTKIAEFKQNSNAKTDNINEIIINGCSDNLGLCPIDYEGNYTLEIIALDNENEQVESTKTTKTIEFKYLEFNGEEYYHVDVIGNETKYTITLDPDDGIQDTQVLGSNYIFGEHVFLSDFESYGFVKQPKVLYYGWTFEDFFVTHDMSVKYEWEPLFTLSLDFNGGSLNGKTTFSKDCVGYMPSLSLDNLMSAFNNGEVVAPEGKELDYVKINGETRRIDPNDGFEFNKDTNIVYYWKYTNETTVHTVTFKDGFENIISSVEVVDGQVVKRPDNPVKGGLLFGCWELEDNCYIFSTPVKSDITLNAYWNFNFNVEANVKNAAIFTYNGLNYPDSIGSSGDYHENDIIGVDQTEINGYQLKEWRLDSVDGTIIGSDNSAEYYITDGGHLKIKETFTSSGHTFYAIYEKTKVAVNFVTNGGTPIEPQYVKPGEYATRPQLYASIKEGYLLGKWYTDQELLNEYTFSSPVESEITLYADWDIYIPEVRGTVNKPVAGFTADTNVISSDTDKYILDFNCWYLTKDGYPHIEGDTTFEKDNEYEIRYHVITKPGYAVDYNTKFYLNDEETDCYGAANARQIRWVATDPVKVDKFNITGIAKPGIGSTFNNGNIKLNTKGLSIKDISWTEEGTPEILTSSDKFAAGKRYILHVVFNTDYGYILDEEFSEAALEGASDYLKAEFVNNITEYDMQIFYEPVNLQVSAPNVKISSSNNQVTLTWNEQYGVTKAEVYRSTDNKKWSKIDTVTTNDYKDKSLTYGKTYYYKVKVKGNGKWTGYSNVVNKKIVPNKVNNLSVTSIGTNNIKLSWNKVSVTGYEVSRSTDNKNWTKVTTITNNNTLEYNNKKLSANKTYYYKVRAYKTVSGKKIYGPYSSVLTVKTAPNKPTLEVKLKDYNAMNIIVGSSKGATKYVVQKSLDGKTYTLVENLPNAGTLAQEDLEVGKTYYYAVKACNSNNNCSGWVKVSLKQTPKTPKLTVESTVTKKVKVTVGKVNGADGYRVYRATSKNGKYELVKEIKDPSELVFNDKTTKGKTYYYKVRSYIVVDGSKVYSPFSGIKTIKSK